MSRNRQPDPGDWWQISKIAWFWLALCPLLLDCASEGQVEVANGPASDPAGEDAAGEATLPDVVSGDPDDGTFADLGDATFDQTSVDDGSSLPDGVPSDALDASPDLDHLDLVASIETTSQWQRGAVSLSYTTTCPGGTEGVTVEVEYSTDAATYFQATPLSGFPDGAGPLACGRHIFVWDSFADVAVDEDSVTVRMRATTGAGAGDWSVSSPFPLLDQPDRNRVVLMTSSINENDKVRLLIHDHETGLSNTREVLSVGFPPERVQFEPAGRTAVVLGAGSDVLLFLSFDEDGSLDHETEVEAADAAFGDAEFLPDSSMLLLLDANPDNYGGGVYRLACDPWTGLPVEASSPDLIHGAFAASSLALLPGRQGFLVLGTSQEDPDGALLLQSVSLDGTLIDEVIYGPSGSMEEALAVSPDGQWILAAHMNWSGSGQAVLFGLTADGRIEEVEDGGTVGLAYPNDLAFHPDSTAALVSQYGPDRVISLSISPAGGLTVVSELPIGIPDQIAHMSVGPDADLYLVTTVHPTSSALGSGIGLFELGSDGSAVALDPFYLGGGADRIPSDVGIQP